VVRRGHDHGVNVPGHFVEHLAEIGKQPGRFGGGIGLRRFLEVGLGGAVEAVAVHVHQCHNVVVACDTSRIRLAFAECANHRDVQPFAGGGLAAQQQVGADEGGGG